MTNPKVENYRIERGLILKILAVQYDKPVDFTVIQRLLDDMGHPVSSDTLNGHLAYLNDPTKAYVRYEKRGSVGITLRFASITPKGLDLLDQVHEENDPGVFVEFK